MPKLGTRGGLDILHHVKLGTCGYFKASTWSLHLCIPHPHTETIGYEGSRRGAEMDVFGHLYGDQPVAVGASLRLPIGNLEGCISPWKDFFGAVHDGAEEL